MANGEAAWNPAALHALKYGSLGLLVLQNTTSVLLMRYAKTRANAHPFANSAMVLMQELLKIIVTFSVEWWSNYRVLDGPRGGHRGVGDDSETSEMVSSNRPDKSVSSGVVVSVETPGAPRDTTPSHRLRVARAAAQLTLRSAGNGLHLLLVPAALFALQSGMLLVALEAVEATMFQVLYQSKVLQTALLMVVLLGRHFSGRKWGALLLLFVGIVFTQLKGKDRRLEQADGNEKPLFTSTGLVAVFVAAGSSSVASVYFEKMLKAAPIPTDTTALPPPPPSLWLRNIQLGFWSLVLGVIWHQSLSQEYGWVAAPASNDSAAQVGLLGGFDGVVWALVVVQAIGGLLVAAVIKYADNALKGFATSVAVLVSGVASMFLFGFIPNNAFLMGAALVIAATLLYNTG